MVENVFDQKGHLLEIGSNRPVLLDDPESVWLVRAEKVDLFAVRIEQGEVVSGRTHVLRVDTGRLLLGMDGNRYGFGLGLLAVGVPGTVLLRLDFERFSKMIADPELSGDTTALLDAWLSGLCLGVQRGIPPRTSGAPDGPGEFSFEKEMIVGPAASGTLWVTHLEGSSCFMGCSSLPLTTGAPPFPLPQHGWLRTGEAVRLKAMDVSTACRRDPLGSCLDGFHHRIAASLHSNITEMHLEESQRLTLKAHNDSASMGKALHGLASILNPAVPIRIANPGETEGLLEACRLVGENLGINIKTPPREALSSSDALGVIARHSGIRTRRIALRDGWWTRDNGPILGHLEESKNPVALLPSSPRSYVLHDPRTGSGIKVTEEVAAGLNSFGTVFYRPLPEEISRKWDFLKEGLRGCANDLAAVLLMGTIGALLGLLVPFTTGIVFETIIPQAARSRLLEICIILLSCAVATWSFEIVKGIALLRIESKMDHSLQTGIMDRLLSLPAPFFRRYTTGDLTDRALGIGVIRQILSGVTIQALLSAVFSLFNLGLLFWYDWALALVAVGLSVVGLTFTIVISLLQMRQQREISEMQGRITGLVLQFITGIAKLRVSGSEDRAFSVWARAFEKKRKAAFAAGSMGNRLAVFNAAFPVFSSMGIFSWIVMWSSQKMNVGDFMGFNSAFGTLQGALLQMSMALMSVLSVVPLYERAKPILEARPEVGVTKSNPGELRGEIEVNQVHFRYSPSGPLVLKNISLRVAPGEFVALVGSSGSGKSTLLRLLLGFETPESGAIFLDGQDLSLLDIHEVRRRMGVVLQNAGVMSGEIYKNIVGSSDLTMDAAWEAASMAGLAEDIRSMPMGMHTVLPPGGGTLSGGQRQRLVIARAIARKPRIILFDEATSALDNLTQAVVGKSLEELQSSRIVIAHRLSTIRHADRIYVMDGGQIVQKGTYEELMEQAGPFTALARRQTT